MSTPTPPSTAVIRKVLKDSPYRKHLKVNDVIIAVSHDYGWIPVKVSKDFGSNMKLSAEQKLKTIRVWRDGKILDFTAKPKVKVYKKKGQRLKKAYAGISFDAVKYPPGSQDKPKKKVKKAKVKVASHHSVKAAPAVAYRHEAPYKAPVAAPAPVKPRMDYTSPEGRLTAEIDALVQFEADAAMSAQMLKLRKRRRKLEKDLRKKWTFKHKRSKLKPALITAAALVAAGVASYGAYLTWFVA